MVDQASESVPKAVSGAPLDGDDGVEVPAQQPVGPGNREGGGEWPDPETPARPPAPGAVDDDGIEVRAEKAGQTEESGPSRSPDARVNRLVARARALADEEAPEADAAAELLAAAGGDPDLLEAAERQCGHDGAVPSAETERAAEYLAAARSI